MSLENVKRGDEVFVVHTGWRRGEGVLSGEYRPVVAAGPKYITVGEGSRRERFHRDTGVVVTDYSPRQFAYKSEAEWRVESERNKLVERAEKLARDLRARRLTNDRLIALIALLEEAA